MQTSAVVKVFALSLAMLTQLACEKKKGQEQTDSLEVTVSTYAGNGKDGYVDGNAAVAEFSQPTDVATDAHGNVYVSEPNRGRIRKITPGGVVSTLAGNGKLGYVDGPGTSAQFHHPYGIATDAQGNVYVADYFNNRVRKITPAGVVSTLAGNGRRGWVDGAPSTAEFGHPRGLAVDAQGNVYVSDEYTYTVRKITPAGVVSTLAGNGKFGNVDGPGREAMFENLRGIAVDVHGNVYVADKSTHSIRKITPAGIVSKLKVANKQITITSPSGVAMDKKGNIYVTAQSENTTYMVSPTNGKILLAGTGSRGFADGLGVSALFREPTGITVDAHGNVYVADYLNHRIRKMTIK